MRKIIKRLFDIVFSSLGLFLLSPLLITIAVIIKIGGPGRPIFYRGIRTGRYGRPFKIYKFRTMIVNAEKVGGPSTALNDPRLTSVGRLLRKYKLDELPQLINILRGEMSFVGPRPQVEQYTRLYSGEEEVILSVRPGLTDYASIKFVNLDEILGDEEVDERYFREIEPEKNKLRIKYVKECSLRVDLSILCRTVVSLFKIR
jgi:lipopolysaccharide/colanic/teichoic acid biosynthesis glycosyltransferase